MSVSNVFDMPFAFPDQVLLLKQFYLNSSIASTNLLKFRRLKGIRKKKITSCDEKKRIVSQFKEIVNIESENQQYLIHAAEVIFTTVVGSTTTLHALHIASQYLQLFHPFKERTKFELFFQPANSWKQKSSFLTNWFQQKCRPS